MTSEPPHEYMMAQTTRAREIFTGDTDANEALLNATRWAAIAYDKAIEHEVPALIAALTIVGSINATLMWKVLQPSEAE